MRKYGIVLRKDGIILENMKSSPISESSTCFLNKGGKDPISFKHPLYELIPYCDALVVASCLLSYESFASIGDDVEVYDNE